MTSFMGNSWFQMVSIWNPLLPWAGQFWDDRMYIMWDDHHTSTSSRYLGVHKISIHMQL
jgi:hypothetical protein